MPETYYRSRLVSWVEKRIKSKLLQRVIIALYALLLVLALSLLLPVFFIADTIQSIIERRRHRKRKPPTTR